MTPRLSIVIPSHQRTDLLERCLASVVQHAPAGTEILVVDDASPGGAASAAAGRYDGVRAVRLPRRGGFCVAANAGLRAARGEFVELLNDDTEVTAGWAEAALAAFTDARVAAVAPLVLQTGGDPAVPRIDSAGDRYYRGGIAGKRGHCRPLDGSFLQPGRVFGASGSSAFYRREVVLRVGAFPEEFGAYFEDVDLSFRLHRAGYEVRYEPASRVWHRGAASHGRPRRRLLEQQSRNEERVFWRNLPLSALPAHAAVVAAKALRRWREGTLAPFVCGRLRVLADVPALWAHRRRLRDLGPAADVAGWQVELRFWE